MSAVNKNKERHVVLPREIMSMLPATQGFSKLVAVAVVSAATALLAMPAVAQYRLTVNGDRLVNAHNEPQNWLLMNGDYASTRYSRLTQINRDNVKDLRMVWAMALGGMAGVGPNGP